jgi:hypothetical protein
MLGNVLHTGSRPMSIGRPMDQRIAEKRAHRTAPNPRTYLVPAVQSLALAATRHSRATTAGQRLPGGYERERVGATPAPVRPQPFAIRHSSFFIRL